MKKVTLIVAVAMLMTTVSMAQTHEKKAEPAKKEEPKTDHKEDHKAGHEADHKGGHEGDHKGDKKGDIMKITRMKTNQNKKRNSANCGVFFYLLTFKYSINLSFTK